MSLFRCLLGETPADDEPLLHVWEHTVGSGHALLALRADWQQHLRRCRRELGFRHVRFHGLLDDDVGTLVREKDELIDSFYNADRIIDFLRSIDMRPFVELSFMPAALASGGDLVFRYGGNVTPPADYDAWEALIGRLVRHWVDRYGRDEVRQWFFEVWNEPNLSSFWKGSQKDYFELYERSARAIKAVDPELAVGGPATAKNEWIPEMLAFCEGSATPLDFVSTHHYPTDAFGQPGDDTLKQLTEARRSVLREQATKARREAGSKPLYYTEWSTSSNPFDELHDQPYAAAFIVKTVMEARALVQGYSYWTFTDIFEENYFSSKPFHGGFGLLTVDGIPKPAYRAFEMLHRLGDRLSPVTGSHETVDVWVTRHNQRVSAIITNGALPGHPIEAETVTLKLFGLKNVRSATLERIDEDNANARRRWIDMGRPERPLPEQAQELERASALRPVATTPGFDEGAAVFEIVVPPQGTALLTVELA